MNSAYLLITDTLTTDYYYVERPATDPAPTNRLPLGLCPAPLRLFRDRRRNRLGSHLDLPRSLPNDLARPADVRADRSK